MVVAKRMEQISPFIVMDVLERARELEAGGADVIHLEVGEPDFETPATVVRAAIEAMEQGITGYTLAAGLRELREEVAAYYDRRYGVSLSPERVLITSGSSPAMLLAFSVILEPDDEVILSNPHYACYPNFILYAGGRPVFVPVREEDGFQYRPEEIAASVTPRTKAILINSPSNPTGNLLSPDTIAVIAEMGPLVISDEIYHGLVYEGEERSILQYTQEAFVINGFSKQFAMTGWRLGWVIAPERFLRPMVKLQQNFFISPNPFVQVGGVAALRHGGEAASEMASIYDKRRRFILPRIRELGFGVSVEPTGAFYVFANAKAYSSDSKAFAFDILEEAHVALSPGVDFGSGGEGYLRFSYANSIENIAQGMNRLASYLRGR